MHASAFAQDIFEEVESGKSGENYEEPAFNEERVRSSSEPTVDSAEIDDLRDLEKFKDIAVIQKKYLDKSKRFELWGAASLALNSQFYDFLGLNLALSYHFTESWGVEFEGLILTDLEKTITGNLQKNQNIVTRSIVVPEHYMGAHVRWSPIYGKMSLRERTINPFEMYFTFGGGVTGINDGQTVPTVHVGTGQVYPMSKNTTFRWALGYNFFQADARSDLNGNISGQKVNTGFLYLSAGVSVFLPFSKAR